MQNLGQKISLENGNFENGKGLMLSWVNHFYCPTNVLNYTKLRGCIKGCIKV